MALKIHNNSLVNYNKNTSLITFALLNYLVLNVRESKNLQSRREKIHSMQKSPKPSPLPITFVMVRPPTAFWVGKVSLGFNMFFPLDWNEQKHKKLNRMEDTKSFLKSKY